MQMGNYFKGRLFNKCQKTKHNYNLYGAMETLRKEGLPIDKTLETGIGECSI